MRLRSGPSVFEKLDGFREAGLPEEQVISLLQKEAKKRQESADLYRTGNNIEKAEHEEAEKKVIDQYLPQQLSEEDVRSLVEEEATKMGTPTLQQMGQLIGAVKQASGGAADGALIARLVKERLA